MLACSLWKFTRSRNALPDVIVYCYLAVCFLFVCTYCWHVRNVHNVIFVSCNFVNGMLVFTGVC